MRYVLIIAWLFVFTSTASAQEKVTVVLKGGKAVEGLLLDALYDEYITVEQNALERVNVHISQVKGIYFGDYQEEDWVKPVDSLFFQREQGFFHVSEIQLMIGQEANGNSFANQTLFQTINGYAWRPWLMIGAGTGLDKYGEFLISPVFASVRGTLREEKVTPYYFVNAGWGHFWQPENDEVTYEEVKGGYHLQLGAGYQFSLDKAAILIGMGYRIQDSYMTYALNGTDWMGFPRNNQVTEERLLRRMVFSLGLTF